MTPKTTFLENYRTELDEFYTAYTGLCDSHGLQPKQKYCIDSFVYENLFCFAKRFSGGFYDEETSNHVQKFIDDDVGSFSNDVVKMCTFFRDQHPNNLFLNLTADLLWKEMATLRRL
jgi:hypothetical protein